MSLDNQCSQCFGKSEGGMKFHFMLPKRYCEADAISSISSISCLDEQWNVLFCRLNSLFQQDLRMEKSDKENTDCQELDIK